VVKFHNGTHKIPDFLIGCMKNMRPIFVNIDSLYILAIDIASKMRTFIYYQATFPLLVSFIGKCCSKKTGAND
jgi:hypothetical protein